MRESSEIYMKKWKCMEDSPNEDDREIKKMPYYLNKLRYLQEKLVSTTQDNCVEFIGTPDNGQIAIVCHTATYELVKSTFQTF